MSSQDYFSDFPLTTPTGSFSVPFPSSPSDLRGYYLLANPTSQDLDRLAVLESRTGTVNVITDVPQSLFWMEKEENEETVQEWKKERGVLLRRSGAVVRRSPLGKERKGRRRESIQTDNQQNSPISTSNEIEQKHKSPLAEHNSSNIGHHRKSKNDYVYYVDSNAATIDSYTYTSESLDSIPEYGGAVSSSSGTSSDTEDGNTRHHRSPSIESIKEGIRPSINSNQPKGIDPDGSQFVPLHIQTKGIVKSREQRSYHRSQSLRSPEHIQQHQIPLRSRRWSGGFKSLDPKSLISRLKKHSANLAPEFKFTEIQYRHMYEISHTKLSSRKRPFYQQMLIAQLIFAYLRLMRSDEDDAIMSGVVKKLTKSIERGGMVGTDKRKVQRTIPVEVKVRRARSKSTGDQLSDEAVAALDLPARGRSKSVTAIVEDVGDDADDEDNVPLFKMKTRPVAQAA